MDAYGLSMRTRTVEKRGTTGEATNWEEDGIWQTMLWGQQCKITYVDEECFCDHF